MFSVFGRMVRFGSCPVVDLSVNRHVTYYCKIVILFFGFPQNINMGLYLEFIVYKIRLLS